MRDTQLFYISLSTWKMVNGCILTRITWLIESTTHLKQHSWLSSNYARLTALQRLSCTLKSLLILCGRITGSREGSREDVEGWPGIKKNHALERVYTIHPNNTECYHLRLLLHEVRGPTSFSDLKTVNGVLHPTYQSACRALSLLEDDKHWDTTLDEAALCDSPHKLRELFSVMLVFCQLSNPLSLWEKYKNSLAEDITRQIARELQDNALHVMDVVYNRCLLMMEEVVLALGGQGLSQYSLPHPSRSGGDLGNRDYLRETSYDINSLAQEVLTNEGSLTDEELAVYK